MNTINKFSTNKMINSMHYNFFTEIDALVIQYTADKLGVANEYTRFKAGLSDEILALNYVRKSEFSKNLTNSKKLLRKIVAGMNDYVGSFDGVTNDPKEAAAYRLTILLKANKAATDVRDKPRDGAIQKLLSELKGDYAADAQTIGLTERVDHLQTEFDAYNTLVKSQYAEKTSQTPLRMETVRPLVDQCYSDMVAKVNAQIVLNGPDGLDDFVNDVNARIKKYEDNIAIHKGITQKKDEDDTEVPAK